MNGFPKRSTGRQWLCLGFGAVGSLLSLGGAETSAHAYAQHGHQRRLAVASAAAGAYNPQTSAIVVDENTGRELYGVNENALRHPASITKVMTLYLLFEQFEKGEMTLDTPIHISEHAAAQEPSKLGIAAGESLRAEDAIKAVVTRSANDVAVAIAEAIGQSESGFAEMMTRKAHALGMSHTLYRNASGLPNDEQWTTAHDLTVLARSLEARFPQYFHYFSTHEFDFAGEVIGNHNHLLGRVAGVDGIKTGYTRASGFNLLTSVHRDGRSIVAVVMGGRTAAARDRTMEALIETHIAEASTQRGRGAAIADNESPVASPAQPRRSALSADARVEQVQDDAASGEGDRSDDDADAAAQPEKVALVSPLPGRTAGSAAMKPKSRPAHAEATRTAATPKLAASRSETRVARYETAAVATPVRIGWIVQIGAEGDAAKAQALLSRARAAGRVPATAQPVAEKFTRGNATFYRARFAGLDEASAQRACKSLRSAGFPCFAAHVE